MYSQATVSFWARREQCSTGRDSHAVVVGSDTFVVARRLSCHPSRTFGGHFILGASVRKLVGDGVLGKGSAMYDCDAFILKT